MKKVLLALLCLINVNVFAEPPKADDAQFISAVSSLSDKCLECAAYYSAAVVGIERNDRVLPTDITRAKIIRDDFFALSYIFAQAADIPEDVFEVKGELFSKQMAEEMDHHFKNFNVLIEKYGYKCKFLYESIDKNVIDVIELELQDIK